MKRLIRKANHEQVKEKIKELINKAKEKELKVQTKQPNPNKSEVHIRGDKGSIFIEHNIKGNDCAIIYTSRFFAKNENGMEQKYSSFRETNNWKECVELLNDIMETDLELLRTTLK